MRTSARPVAAPSEGQIARLRRGYNGFIARHEVAWELTMAAMAILYVIIGFAGDTADARTSRVLGPAEGFITALFVAEFSSRFLASFDRRGYLRGHWIDLVALVPTIREIRVLRLLRLLRLVRVAAGIYRAVGVPALHRAAWHFQRLRSQVDPRTGMLLGSVLLGLVLLASVVVTWVEGPWTFEQLGEAVYWSITTLLGAGDGGFVSTFVGRMVSAALIVSSLTLLAVATGGRSEFRPG